MAGLWHACGMKRVRVSTTVDSELLGAARNALGGTTDSQLIDLALRALLARYRSAEINASYEAAYAAHPINEPDEWGDLASFVQAASAT